MAPAYISIFIVEKYYTAFWTGFWNIYGLFVTSVGLALDNYNPWWVWGLLIAFIILAIALYGIVFEDTRRVQDYVVRRVGASWFTSSLNWGLYIGFTTVFWLGIVAVVVHALIIFFLIILLDL